ncbi:MAG: KTSC domain-containing protein [Promethearchaeota archaeon]
MDKRECISYWISELTREHPEWEQKQVIAVAYAKCDATKKDFEGTDFCPWKIVGQVNFANDFKDMLYSDFTSLPTSIIIAQAVDFALPKLKEKYPTENEVDLLKIAYKIAQTIVSNSDFEEIEEEPVYFAIEVDDIEEFEKALSYSEDYTDDNLYKIEKFNIDGIIPAVEFKESDLEQEKLEFFAKIAKDDLKNIPPIFIDEGYQIWDGHHRFFALKKLGYEFIYAVQLPTEILKKIDYHDFLKFWDYSLTSNVNTTRFDTELNRFIKELSDFTDDKAPNKFFAEDKPVTSSNVAEVGYDNGRLRIFFKNGWGYEYDVGPNFYLEMMTAPSKGKYIWEYLRGKTPGRVIDKPWKITPGGVGGSIVPYFKIKGARMPRYEMAESVRKFLRAAVKGKAKVGQIPIKQIPKPTYKQFDKFLKSYLSGKERIKQFFRRFIPKKPVKNPQNPPKPTVPTTPVKPLPNQGQPAKPLVSRKEARKAKQRENDLKQIKHQIEIHYKQDRNKELSEKHKKIFKVAEKSFEQAYQMTEEELNRLNNKYYKEKSISRKQFEDESYVLYEMKNNFEIQKERYPEEEPSYDKEIESLAKEINKLNEELKKKPTSTKIKQALKTKKEKLSELRRGRKIGTPTKRVITRGSITDPSQRIEGRIRSAVSYQRKGAESKYEKQKEGEKERKTEQILELREQIAQIRKKLRRATKLKNKNEINNLRKQLNKLLKQLGDLQDFMVDDFTDDMQYFRGPITRAGKFQYGLQIKEKDLNNLKEVTSRYKHLPSFDSHQENRIIGFAYNFTDDPDLFMKDHPRYNELVGKPYIFSEGYVFDDIENTSNIEIIPDQTLLPVSIRFFDQNEGTDNTYQNITDLIHLAISVDANDQDRCSTLGGDPCWVSFHDRRQESNTLMEQIQIEGDFMPKDKKEEEEDSGASDGKTEGMDAEYEHEKKQREGKEDFVPMSEFVKLRKAYEQAAKDVQDMAKEVSSMREKYLAHQKKVEEIELKKLKSDFSENEKYRIKSDFLEKATLEQMKLLKQALENTPSAPLNPANELFDSDFQRHADNAEKLREKYKKIYGVD